MPLPSLPADLHEPSWSPDSTISTANLATDTHEPSETPAPTSTKPTDSLPSLAQTQMAMIEAYI